MRLDDRSSYAFGSYISNSDVGEMSTVLVGSVVTADVGKMSIVGANSFVDEVVEDYCLVVGNPAKVVKRLK